MATSAQLASLTDLRSEARTLYLAGINPDKIAEHLGIKRDRVAQWAHRGKWITDRAIVQSAAEKAMSRRVTNALAQHGAKAALDSAKAIADHATALASTPAKLAQMRSTPKREGTASVLKRVVDAGATLFGWGNESGKDGLVSLARVSTGWQDTVVDVEQVTEGEPDKVLDTSVEKPDDNSQACQS